MPTNSIDIAELLNKLVTNDIAVSERMDKQAERMDKQAERMDKQAERFDAVMAEIHAIKKDMHELDKKMYQLMLKIDHNMEYLERLPDAVREVIGFQKQ